MTVTDEVPTTVAVGPREAAADAAGAAALLEIGDRLGLLPHIDQGQSVTAARLAAEADLPEEGVANYLEAMSSAGIMVDSPDGEGGLRVADDFDQIQYESGYLSWAMNANRPFVNNAVEFLRAPLDSRAKYPRDGRQVAVSSEWMGSKGFYPVALQTILDARPSRVVDLGAGTARLLIEVMLQLPETTAVALDLDGPSCEEAVLAAERAGVADRLTVIEAPIQSVAEDPTPVLGADVVHAGFVFHDMMPDEEHVADAVLANCREGLRPGGMMAITDAVPYVKNIRERRFSAIVSYYHKQFMRRRLLSEEEWTAKLSGAGFSSVECVPHRFPTGRLFRATKA
ncbi:SAM-dependent methyltransferase [Actinoalloteichus sp. AHMU CJ021]|uniref:Methyltransferase domain-containing protein n=1 Tax=Actinoalloteichus caeruleus DSM 43889 TaxID=1120930 RepID=A0ABT1JES7_ACTCY|nr:class I SAM-dependent methyltransferase [Actinoalloteichus caeruleus]AUS79527.1 SAM-dependent methyltransferase [Actinoalloteichus sp. AHMU CJ021]MCP2330673.1 Methyltransferase domain-containing protein [Actinoalloteichus caeruleus DSM 43889]